MKRSSLKEMQISAASGDEDSEEHDEKSSESSFAASGNEIERFDLLSLFFNIFCCFLFVESLLFKRSHK